MPVYGLGKNLLDNWYFVGGGSQQGGGQFPINQRGQTNYLNLTGVYCVDRWHGYNGLNVSVASSGLQLTASENGKSIVQNFAMQNAGVYTLSALTSTGLVTASGTLPNSPTAYTNYIQVNDANNHVRFLVYLNGSNLWCVDISPYNYTSTVTLIAAKLELGSEQTLCHNEGTDANPVWVLNEVPDYEYELYRCMTSTADSADTYANKTLATGQEIAYVENGTTASRAYAAGEFFCWNGLLYQVITAIPSGASFTIGTNCEAVPGGGFNQLSSISIKVFSNWRYNANLDNYLSPGVFWIASGAINSPSINPWCPLLVLPRGTSSPDTVMQVMFLDGYISTRRLAGGSWTPWKTVALST